MNKIMEKLKNVKPWQWVVIAAVVIAGIVASLRKNSGGGGEAAPADPTPASATQEVSGKMTEITSTLQDALSAQQSQILKLQQDNEAQSASFVSAFNQLANTFSSYQQTTDNILQETNRSFDALNKQMQNNTVSVPVVQSIATRETKVETMSMSDYDKKKTATAQITDIQTKWRETNKAAQADGILTEAEKKALNDLHEQANKAGIEAGLGDGGNNGAARKMVY